VTVALFGATALVTVADARRLARASEKTAIIVAVRRAHQLAKSQTSACLKAYVSTVDPSWATLSFIYTARCAQQDANGIAIVHRRSRRWRFVTAGSDFTCPLPDHIPAAVQKDLKLFCRPGG
jgi:hypothetical protein